MVPQQNKAGATGLASLQQHGVAIPGETKNMEYFFNLAKKMSDGQLADILSGKSLDVPQFVAMTEAMGRKQLRQAVAGAQAQQQAQKPSIKDQLLAETAAGIDQLAAPNLEGMGEGHAAGGIIAFEDGGEVPGFYKGGDPWAEQRAREEDPNVFMSKAWFKKHFEGAGGLSGSKAAERKADIAAQQKLNARENPEFGEPILRTDEDPYGQTTQANQVIPNSAPGVTEPPVAPAAPPEKKNYLTQGQGQDAYKRRVSPFGEFNPEAVDYNKLKDQGLGQAMLGASKALLSKRGAAGIGEAFEALGTQAGLTRKEIQGLQRDERDYKLNLAKANELFEQGQDKLAFDYLKQAQDNRYHMLMATKPGSGLELLQALKDPTNMKIWQQMNALKKPTDIVSKEKALAQWKNVGPKERREKYGDDFNTYYNTINNQLLTDTIGDGVVLGKV